MFFLKKLLSRFLFPVPLCAELLVLGLLLWFFTKWKKLGRGLVVAGTSLLLLVFGLQTNAVQVCASAWDTEDEVRWCKNVVGTNRVIIVSSASHLPRAMLLARRHGLDVVAVPSGFLVDTVTQAPFSPDRLFPSSINLYLSERAMYEYLGLVWERVRGGGGQ